MQRASHICVRPATPADAPMIARAVAMAIGDEMALTAYCGADYHMALTAIAATEATQYSWQYGLVAEVSGVVAGAIVGYDGAALHRLRAGTYRVLDGCIGRVPSIADETEAGEYYLDSVGVFPEFRGMGVGRQLVAAFCKKALAEGHERIGLMVDFDNPNAEKLYRSLGFERVGERLFFGHRMRHLQRRVTKEN